MEILIRPLNISIAYDLFDSTVLPILVYGSEVWGYSNLDYIENLHFKFCKILLDDIQYRFRLNPEC